MCFNQEMSGFFAVTGWLIAAFVWSRTKNWRLAAGVAYFAVMETLQSVQYIYIDDCESKMNQYLTLFGFLHITFQPWACHGLINAGLTRSKRKKAAYLLVGRLCLIGGALYFGRYFFAEMSSSPITSDFTDWAKNEAAPGACRTQEWVRGETLCTYNGRHHLAWSIPMYEPTYYSPSGAIHSFLMFAPFFVMGPAVAVQGAFLFLTGPALAAYITPNLQEQASIWCFFSIAQIFLMLFGIRSVIFGSKAQLATDKAAAQKAKKAN